jgi:hypothetical protein
MPHSEERTWIVVSVVVGESLDPAVENRKKNHPAIVNGELTIKRKFTFSLIFGCELLMI